MPEKIPLQAVAPGKKDPAWVAHYQAGEFRQSGKVLPFRLYAPEVQTGEKYPLVLWLHGVKGRGEDNHKQLTAGNAHGPAFFAAKELQERYPCYVLVPQCPGSKFWISFTSLRIKSYLKLAVGLTENLRETLPIDHSRIYVGGQSMGAFATWALLAGYPELFAAGIPVSGGGSTRKAKRAIKAPVWIFHGASDPIVRVIRSREMAAAMEAAGKAVRYTEFPDGRHDIWPQVFAEPNFAEWLFSNKTENVKRRR
ncbi:MAG: phospholipase [Bacteroidia bacterium]